jgi:hypothetical protein
MGGLPSSLLSIPPVSFVMPRGSLNWKILVFGTEMKPISYKTTCYLHIHGPKIILQVIVKYLTSPLEICLPITRSVASIKGLCSCCLISFQQDPSPRTIVLMVRARENCSKNRIELTRHMHGTAIDLSCPFLAHP